MSLFENAVNKTKLTGTTDGFFFGAPEAEAEKKYETDNHVSFFNDYFDIINEMASGKFIITGRKGTGKSAIVKYLLDQRKDDETYVDIVRPNEYVIYKNAITSTDGVGITSEMIWEWVLLTRFVKMILSSDSSRYYKEYKPLEKFWKNNSGFLEIDKFDVQELITRNNYQLSIGPLKQIMDVRFQKTFDSREIHAPFYKLIPALKDVVGRVIHHNVYKDKDFILMFDDLDIKFRMSDEKDKQDLLQLIRLAKEYNTSVLNGTNGRIFIFIRDDVSREMQSLATDTSKIFGSYECVLKWYNHEIGNDDDSNNRIKRFVNHRLKINFDRLHIDYNANDPWSSFIMDDYSVYERKTPFKYLLDFTFYRPRDFINIFKNLGQKKYRLPLSPANVKTLLREYVESNFTEICSELTNVFSQTEIDRIKKVLKVVSIEAPVSFERGIELLSENQLGENVFEALVEYNLLIPQDDYKKQYFSYREKYVGDDLENYHYALPKSIYAYFRPSTILPGVA